MNVLSNTPPTRDSKELQKHFSDTYFCLRLGLAVLAFGLPLVLVLAGELLHGLEPQPSMSAYFWAANKGHCAIFPMRTVFVGFLCALGAGLYLYKGLTPLENSLLNVAAIAVAVVAVFPERIVVGVPGDDPRLDQLFASCPAVKEWAEMTPFPYSFPIHVIAAVTVFVLLALVAWLCASKSLECLPTGTDPSRFRRLYKGTAVAMILAPIAALVAAYLFGAKDYVVLIVEALGVWTFGFYWAVKTRELSLSRLESDPEEAVHRTLQPPAT